MRNIFEPSDRHAQIIWVYQIGRGRERWSTAKQPNFVEIRVVDVTLEHSLQASSTMKKLVSLAIK